MQSFQGWIRMPKRQHSSSPGILPLSERSFRSPSASPYSQTPPSVTPMTDPAQTGKQEYISQGPYSAGHGSTATEMYTAPQTASGSAQESGASQMQPQGPRPMPNGLYTANGANTEFSIERKPISQSAVVPKPDEHQARMNAQNTSQGTNYYPSSPPWVHGYQPTDKELLQSEMIEKLKEVDQLKMEKSTLLQEREEFRQKWKKSDECYQELHAQYQKLLAETSKLQALVNNRDDKKESERSKLQKQDEGLKRKLHTAEDKLIAAASDIRRHKDDIDIKNQQIKNLEAKIARLGKDAVNQQEDIERRKSELKKMDNDLETLKIENTHLSDRNKALTNTARDQARCIEDLEKELSEAKDFGNHQAQSIKKIQEKAFQTQDEAQWMQDTNEEVSDQLNGIGKQLQKWCRIYCSKIPLHFETMSAEDKASIQDLLTHVGNEEKFNSHFDDNDVSSRLTELLLLSSLSDTLYSKIFCNPFFFEKDDLGATNVSNSWKDGPLSSVWGQILKSDRKAANHWAAQTLQLLDPNSKVMQSMRNPSNPISNQRQAAAERFSGQFIARSPQALLDANSRKPAEDRMAQLTEIGLKAAEISYRLWTQKRELSCLRMHELEAESALQFDSTSQLLEHHPLHNVQLSQDEMALDGKAVVIVTQPVVVAYGDSDGDNYAKRTVLKKAVVWMG